jgi:hypothetical protein
MTLPLATAPMPLMLKWMFLLPLPSYQRNIGPQLFFATLLILITKRLLQFKGFRSELFGLGSHVVAPN